MTRAIARITKTENRIALFIVRLCDWTLKWTLVSAERECMLMKDYPAHAFLQGEGPGKEMTDNHGCEM